MVRRRRTVVESGTAFSGPAGPSTPPLGAIAYVGAMLAVGR